jgi:RNA polymerase sigma factor (sigma-70 family)
MASAPQQEPDFEQIIEEMAEMVFRYAASRLQRADAENVRQEAVIVLLKPKWRGMSRAELTRVAQGIAVRLVIAVYRKQARRAENSLFDEDGTLRDITDAGVGPGGIVERNEVSQQLGRIITSLPEPCRTILRLHLEDRPGEEIRQAMRIENVKTVHLQIHRCLKKVAEKYRRAFPGSGDSGKDAGEKR